ncbi:MAG: FAD-dependent oxidoreductase [Chloroflexi bacterium]|nr:FAD-dependent oxidoreductase [Chloroflexota bacterium]
MTTQETVRLPESADIIIVGAGIAGLYCAWRLLDKDRSLNVVVVDRLNRTGGRLDTDLIKIDTGDGDVTVRDEEGGMRFNYEMNELMALNGSLGLCDDIVPFPMSPTSGPNYNRYYMRGYRSTVEQAPDQDYYYWSEAYPNLSDDEKGKSPVTIITEVYHKILKQNGETPPDSPTPKDWQKFRLEYTWNGTLMNEWQLWGLLRDMGYSEECIKMLSDAIGFEGPFLSLANAGEAFQILEDFPKDPTYFTFRRGYSTLPDALREKIEDAGGQIFLGTNVDAINSRGNSYRLKLTVAPPDQSSSPFVENGVTRYIDAPKIILAVASKALANLYGASPVFNESAHAEQLWRDIQSVVNMRLLKINLYYDEEWWENLDKPVSYGPSFTDLPLGSVYPFYSLQGPENYERPAALTIYCDFNNTNFWQHLQNVEPYFNSVLQEHHTTTSPQVLFPASEAVVGEATKQFKLLYDYDYIPEPILTSYRLWGGESDFGYAYHQWALNADDKGVIRRLIEPIDHVYVCNEAYSDMQGWVNGSLRSADLVMSKFNIQPLVDDPDSEPCQPST